MTLPFYDAVKQLQDAYLMFPAFQKAFDQVDANLKLYRATGIAQNLLIMGESGTGKSSLSKLLTERYPMQTQPEQDVMPILLVSVPPAATIAGTVEAILAKLGDPEPARGTVSVKTARAVKIARACNVEMTLLDEAQHIQDRGRAHSQYFVGDWLKSFMDALEHPFTLLGLPRTQSLLQVNEQLRRRFAHRLSLSVQPVGADSTEDNSLELFASLANALPLPLDPRPFGWRELGMRLQFATDGRIAYVKQLLVSAYEHAVNQECTSITPHTLGLAFTASIWPAGIGQLNPFHAEFIFRPLDRLGEPFQMGEMGPSAPQRRLR